MTSYSHYNDEAFNIYTAKINGAKLVILQHGHQGHHDLCGTYYEKEFAINILLENRSKEKNNTFICFYKYWKKDNLKP